MFITDDTPPAVSDDNFFAILKERNPELFGAMNEYINAENALKNSTPFLVSKSLWNPTSRTPKTKR